MRPTPSNLVFLQYLTTAFDNIKDAILLIGVEKHTYRLLTANAVFFAISGFQKVLPGSWFWKLSGLKGLRL
jgi:hypothetical protein